MDDYDGITRGIFTGEVRSCGWNVGITLEKEVLYEDVHTMLNGFAIAMIISFAVGVVIIFLVTRKVVESLGRLEHTVTSRDISENIQVNTRDEVGRLAKGFNQMMKNLRVEERIEVVDKLGKTILSNIENINTLQGNVAILEYKSADITDIIFTITGIFGQTNLLALNASIEAALSVSEEQAKITELLTEWSKNLQKQADDLKKTENFRKE